MSTTGFRRPRGVLAALGGLLLGACAGAPTTDVGLQDGGDGGDVEAELGEVLAVENEVLFGSTFAAA